MLQIIPAFKNLRKRLHALKPSIRIALVCCETAGNFITVLNTASNTEYGPSSNLAYS